jgi:hypothetical protein
MSSGYWSNLRPLEKRMVVGIGSLFFIVLNFLFVIPHFSDWSKVQERKFQAERKLKVYQDKIAQKAAFERQVKTLESEGLAVPAEDQALHFANTIQAQALQSKVIITSNSKITDRTNEFFLEKSQSISTESGESQLVDFLYNLGSGNSLIRVRDLSIRPDPPRQKLVANIKLVASYQKKAPAPAPAAKPGGAGPAAPSAATPSSTAKRP